MGRECDMTQGWWRSTVSDGSGVITAEMLQAAIAKAEEDARNPDLIYEVISPQEYERRYGIKQTWPHTETTDE